MHCYVEIIRENFYAQKLVYRKYISIYIRNFHFSVNLFKYTADVFIHTLHRMFALVLSDYPKYIFLQFFLEKNQFF